MYRDAKLANTAAKYKVRNVTDKKIEPMDDFLLESKVNPKCSGMPNISKAFRLTFPHEVLSTLRKGTNKALTTRMPR